MTTEEQRIDGKSDIQRKTRVATVKRRSILLGRFLSGQLVAQILSLIAGIILVRCLNRTEYAYFTIANTMQSSMNILADSGISIGVLSIGGKVWNDRYRFGQLVNAALQLRRSLAIASVSVVGPILFWMLVSNGASIFYTLCILVAVLAALSSQLTIGVFEVVPRLRSEIVRLTQLDLIAALTRLLLLVVAYLLFMNAAVAVATASVSLVVKSIILRRWASEGIDVTAPTLLEDKQSIFGVIKKQAPNSVFYCVQGQITVFLISIFGNVKHIAEVGALGRLAIVFTLAGSVMTNIVAPRFSKLPAKDLSRFYWQTIGIFMLFATLLLACTVFFPRPILLILGKQYSNLDKELVLMMLTSLISSLLGVVWALNSSRGWLQYIWLYIPLTLITQAVILFFVDVSSTQGVLIFGLISSVPNLLLNLVISQMNLRKLATDNVIV